MRSRRSLLLLLALTAVITGLVIQAMPSATVHGEEPIAYAGSKQCKVCHTDQHKAWVKMPHSRAWKALTPEQIASGKDETTGKPCIQCHTTGYGRPGGFVSEKETPKLMNVGCESCHGPGKKHVKTMTLAMMNEEENVKEKFISPTVGTCTECHNPHVSHKEKYGAK